MGSRTLAYERVGSIVGVSGSWISKFIKNRPEVKGPGIITALNIIEAYNVMCMRVRESADRRLAEAHELRAIINAAVAGTAEMVASDARAQSSTSNTENNPTEVA